jgi:phytoene/squalene synthetase
MNAPASFSMAAMESNDVSHLDDVSLAEAFKQSLRQEILANRGPKYRAFFYGMEAAVKAAQVMLPQGKERTTFLGTYYALMRYIDDVVDGDRPLPDGYESATAFVEELLAWNDVHANEEIPPQNPVQRLLNFCLDMGKRFDADFHDETRELLGSMLFDAKRRGTGDIHAEQELQDYFHSLDIRGTIRGCLKAFAEDPTYEADLMPLGEATRIHYNLRDLEEDIQAGLINISREDMARLGITRDDVAIGIQSNSVREWCREQGATAFHMLEEHQKIVTGLPLKSLTKMVLFRRYEKPARQFLAEYMKTMDCPVESPSRISILARHPVRYGLAAMNAERLSWMHREALGVRDDEEERYITKARRLALCYSDLSTSRDPRVALRAGTVGFFSAAYDAITDFHGRDDQSKYAFGELLTRYVTEEERNIAMELYEKDESGTLANDSLERGSLALRSIVSVMGIRDELDRIGMPIDQMGEELQIIDDILDVEEDCDHGDMNCLRTPNARMHLERILQSDLHLRFATSTVMRSVIDKARLKGYRLLKECL